MGVWIRRILAPPVFEDEKKARTARLLNTILLAVALLVSVAAVVILVVYGLPVDLFGLMTMGMVLALVGTSLGLLWLNRRGHVQLASEVLVALLWLLTTVTMYSYAGLVDVTVSAYVLAVAMAGILLGRGALLFYLVASMLSAAGLVYTESYNLLTFVKRGAEPFDLIILGASLALTGMVARYAVRTSDEAIDRARRGEQALADANRELEVSRASLQESLSALERRSAYLQASADVGQAASSILDTSALIAQVVDLIRDRFGFYYVGLFLIEVTGSATPPGTGQSPEQDKWAVLRAGTGQAGQAMLARGHRIRAGEGMIGWTIDHAQARVALDVGDDAARLATPELPDTRSEAALPLRSRGRVLGALTVQSDQPAAFDQDTLAVLQTMADQVAVALDNASLFAESQTALEAARAAYGQVTRQAWQDLLRALPDIGFRRDSQGLAPAGDVWHPEMAEAMRTGKILAEQAGVAIPIEVRGQVIGVIDAHKPGAAGHWTTEELEVIQTLTDQLGVALEGARLFREARRHAAHEEAVRRVTEEMRRGLDIEAILQTTVAELGRVLGVPRAYVRLGVPVEPAADHPGADPTEIAARGLAAIAEQERSGGSAQ